MYDDPMSCIIRADLSVSKLSKRTKSKSLHGRLQQSGRFLHQMNGLQDRDLVRFHDVSIHDHLVQNKVRFLQVEHDLPTKL